MIDCTATAVILQPGQLTLSLARVSAPNGTDPLVKAIQESVARHQARLRPDEAPYQPKLLFRVAPDGLRAFYAVYPALGNLGLPMTRDGLRPEDTRFESDDQ